MTRACRPLTAWRRPARLVGAACLFVCAGTLLAPPRIAAQTCGGPALESQPPALLGQSPAAVAPGDYDRDGTLDVVVVSAAGPVLLLRGDGTGGLAAPVQVGTVLDPRDVVAGDFNRDGKLDLAVASAGSDSVAFFSGNGSGGFALEAPVSIGVDATRLALADVDRDGWTDVVVVSQSGGKVILLRGTAAFAFERFSPDFDVAGPRAVAIGDFDRNGWLDLAVARSSGAGDDTVQVFEGQANATPPPFVSFVAGASVAVGGDPQDVAVGDLDRDGTLDLVTADRGAGTASVLIGDGSGGFTVTETTAVGGQPERASLVDFNGDGRLDLVVRDANPAAPLVTVVPGKVAPLLDDTSLVSLALPASSVGVDLALGDLWQDGRTDVVVPLQGTTQSVLVARNTSGPLCGRTSFAGAPQAFAAGDGPVAAAAGDFDEDGVEDLVVAAQNGASIELLRGSGGRYETILSLPMPTAPPRGVAVADFDLDGHLDVVAALGTPSIGRIQVFLGDGGGGLTPTSPLTTGENASAVVAGDFNADGAADMGVTSQSAHQVQVFLGNGEGAFFAPTTIPLGAGAAPRALAAGDLDGNGTLDLVVAHSGLSSVSVLLGDGDGMIFTPAAGSPLTVGSGPWSVAVGDFDGNGVPDLVTADNSASTVSVLLGSGGGAFGAADSFTVDGPPIAVGTLDVTGDGHLDVVAVTGADTLNLLPGDGAGGFATPATLFPVRTRPSAVVPVDADADGRLDLVVPCRDADSLVVLLSRPPAFDDAVRVAVGGTPTAAATADLDADGDLDLAVVDTAGNAVTVLTNDGSGGFAAQTPVPVGLAPQSVAIADLDRDGVLDLAVGNAQGNTVSILLGLAGGGFTPGGTPGAGSAPDDLAVGDFDRDGDLDLAVCNKVSPVGSVTILVNDGLGGFTAGPSLTAGNAPTGVHVADLDLNGTLDLVVANDDSDDLTLWFGNGDGTFTSSLTLPLDTDDGSPVSVTAADLDGDGDPDLATVAFASNGLNVFAGAGGTFPDPPVRHPVADQPLFVTVGDANRDGRPDLLIVADGVKVFRGNGGLAFETSDDFLAGRDPAAAAVGDFDGDGWLDLAVPNATSGDVSILLSSACDARRLVVSTAPAGCGTGAAPFAVAAEVEARDEGGNVASCATGGVIATLVGSGASLGGDADVAFDQGAALFGDLTVSAPGRRFRLRFDRSGGPALQPTLSRTFTLGQDVTIVGPSSVCPSSPESHSVDPGFDSYLWTTDGMPYGFTPTITLTSPPLSVSTTHLLAVEARIDACLLADSRSVHLGDLASVDVSVVGPTTVCVDCLGGTATAVETGGGPVLGRQWGFRTESGGVVTPLTGQTSDTYVLNGLDFPGPGTYFLVETTQPTCETAVTSNEVTVLVEAVVGGGEVRSLGVTSRGSSSLGENVVQWVNTSGNLAEIRIRWNKAPTGTSSCGFPSSPVSGPFDDEHVILSPAPLSKGTFPHTGLELDTAYCYSVFTKDNDTGTYAPGRVVRGRPFDTTEGAVKWAYSTGATAVVPPVVGGPGVLAMSNDRTVHSLERGSAGGLWPTAWVPKLLTGVAHSRSPVVPLQSPLNGADSVLLVGDDAGDVHVIDAVSGAGVWTVTPFTPPEGAAITGAPGATLVQFGGPTDLVLVGTRNNDETGASQFVALKLRDNGALADAFDGMGTPGGGLGPVSATPAVDNAAGRVYFTSRRLAAGAHSVWCLSIDGSGAFTYEWSLDLGEIDNSPVLRNGRLYVANAVGGIHSIDAGDGSDVRAYDSPDGPVKGFVFPDRRNDDLFFSTSASVRSIADTPAGFVPNWAWSPLGLEPSIVLFRPQTSFVYVGGLDGTLYQLDFSLGAPSTTCDAYPGSAGSSCIVLVLGDGLEKIGAPSMDIFPPVVSPGKVLLHVGSESGTLYAVEVPFP